MKILTAVGPLVAIIMLITSSSASAGVDRVETKPCDSQRGVPCEVGIHGSGTINLKKFGKKVENAFEYVIAKKNPIKGANRKIKKIFGW